MSELIRLLGFEDGEQVENFCDHYCLTVEGDEIVMDAQAFLEPESSIPETRSPTLVEAKRSVSVGEVGFLMLCFASEKNGKFDLLKKRIRKLQMNFST